jgi:hypothetical protein
MKIKNSLPFLITLSISFHFLSFAAINPIYKECMQRGYNVSGEYCVFPDSSQCLLEDFNGGKCGQKWMTDDYCIPEGSYVWDADKCCEGLVAYLPKDVAGSAGFGRHFVIIKKEKKEDLATNFRGIAFAIIKAEKG